MFYLRHFREYETLNRRVENDVKNQQILEQHLLQEKITNLQRAREQQKKLSDDDKIESYSEYAKQLNGLNNTLASVSTNSSTDLPEAVYYNLHEEQQRPKSATQIIKKQLELESIVHKKSPIRLVSNKTVPISIYGLQLPKSADEKRRRFRNERNLKSAGDCDMPKFLAAAAGDGGLHRQLYELNHFNVKKEKNKNAISVVEVD